MKIDEGMLRAYVDGELSPLDRNSVELAIEHSEELRSQLFQLRASCLPYRAAFDSEVIPEMPKALQQQLAALSAVAAAPPHSSPKRLANDSWLNSRFALAASFLIGALVALAFGSIWVKSNPFGTETASWVNAIASYQALYVRDTVDRAADSADRAGKVIRDFEVETRAKLVVPDLATEGFEFKRIQRLGIRVADSEKPLIQMAYLPTKGKPGALCVLYTAGDGDIPVKAQRLENLSVVTWKRGKLSYVLAVDLPLEQAATIGAKLEAGQFPLLHTS
jgi:anti-sigma factor RsiW